MGERGRDRVDILGVPVDRLTLDEAVSRIIGFIGEGGSHVVLTPNPEIVHRALKSPDLMEILKGADLSLADGTGLVWASRYLGDPLPERVTGMDVVEALLEVGDKAEARGLRVFLLGAREEVCRMAAEKIERLFPRVEVCGYHHGYFGPGEEESIVELIRRCAPDILLVGMGSPKQEKWLAHHLAGTGVPVGIAVGGCFDVLAGKVARAPGWVRRLGLEWLFRIVRQPFRIKRAMAIPAFIIKVITWNRGRRR